MKRFPVLGTSRSVPWTAVEPWRDMAKQNHAQTLERLAERGGLSVRELWALMHGKSLREALFGQDRPTKAECEAWLSTLDDAG